MIIAVKVEHTNLSFDQLMIHYETSLAELRFIKREIKKRLKEEERFTPVERKKWLLHMQDLASQLRVDLRIY